MNEHQAAQERIRLLQEVLDLTPELNQEQIDYNILQLALETRQQLLKNLPPEIDEKALAQHPDLRLLVAQAAQLTKTIIERDQALLAEMEIVRKRLANMLRQVGSNPHQPTPNFRIYSRMA